MEKIMSEYRTFEDAYTFFNKRLFAGCLSEVLITIHHQGAKTFGFFSPERFKLRGGKKVIDEIALNPDCFLDRSDKEILSTLAHEMAHVWQALCGEPSRNGYHNREWGRKMEEIGLTPSNTGKPGGKKTGQQMTHYVVEGGAFDIACKEFLRGAKIQWGARVAAKPEKIAAQRKTKYSCRECGVNVWGKPDLNIVCGDCESPMIAEG